MATGTGKTIVAALDFRRLYESGQVKSLLFVAHRKEILQQSLQTFRAVLKEGSFGELLVDGVKPSKWKFVFGSIQSLSNLDKTKITPQSFDMVIIDEFHHAAAESYEMVRRSYICRSAIRRSN
jgi:superfamily II DNA or RNA helicase